MKKLVFAHLSIWIGFFLLFSPVYLLIPSTFQIPDDISITFYAISLMVTTVVAFYSSYFFTKQFIIKKPGNAFYPIVFFILLIQSIVLLSFSQVISSNRDLIIAFIHIVLIVLFVIFGGVLQFQMAWNNKNNELRLELEHQNHKSQMAFLISQINPHFLFNTLHNIDTLIHENQDKASNSLVKLSEIMRYMLKESNSYFVELLKEIEHLENYLSLEQLRLKTDKFLNYSINGNCKNLKIAPLILIPFVENAFKHSIDSSIENGIIIKISIENRMLVFICENQFDESYTDNDKVHGIGLTTVKKRLDLIYENKHKLTINSEKSIFKVKLEIELNEN